VTSGAGPEFTAWRELPARLGHLYAFADVSRAISALGCRDDSEFAELSDEAGARWWPGSGFGAPGHMRLSFACSMPPGAALNRIARILIARVDAA